MPVNPAYRLCVKDGIERLRLIVAPHPTLERLLLEERSSREDSFAQISAETDWFYPKLQAFLKDEVLQHRFEEMLRELETPSVRPYIRRDIRDARRFEPWIESQCAVLRAAGASETFINAFAHLQRVTRAHLIGLPRLTYPKRKDVEKLLSSMEQLLGCACDFLDNAVYIAEGEPDRKWAEMSGSIGDDCLILASIAVNAVTEGWVCQSTALVVAHYFASEIKARNRLIGVIEGQAAYAAASLASKAVR